MKWEVACASLGGMLSDRIVLYAGLTIPAIGKNLTPPDFLDRLSPK